MFQVAYLHRRAESFLASSLQKSSASSAWPLTSPPNLHLLPATRIGLQRRVTGALMIPVHICRLQMPGAHRLGYYSFLACLAKRWNLIRAMVKRNGRVWMMMMKRKKKRRISASARIYLPFVKAPMQGTSLMEVLGFSALSPLVPRVMHSPPLICCRPSYH